MQSKNLCKNKDIFGKKTKKWFKFELEEMRGGGESNDDDSPTSPSINYTTRRRCAPHVMPSLYHSS